MTIATTPQYQWYVKVFDGQERRYDFTGKVECDFGSLWNKIMGLVMTELSVVAQSPRCTGPYKFTDISIMRID